MDEAIQAIKAKYEKVKQLLGTPDPKGVKEVKTGVWKQAYTNNGGETAAIYYIKEHGV